MWKRVARWLAWREPRVGSKTSAIRRDALGKRAERLARTFLERQGYEILATNVRFPVGELDLVARDGGTLCFIEVRSTTTDQFGPPIASITDAKRRRLLRAATWYLNRHPRLADSVRFDVVTVQWSDAHEPSLELIRAAFDAD